MCTTTGHRKRRDDDSDLGRTRTATGQKKRSLISQTAAHREERLAVERLQCIPFFITSSYNTCILPYTSFSLSYVFTLSPYPFFVITHLYIKFINCCMIEVRGMSYALCVCLVIAERRERSERSEANNRVLFEIPRYLYIISIIIIRVHHVQKYTRAILPHAALCHS